MTTYHRYWILIRTRDALPTMVIAYLCYNKHMICPAYNRNFIHSFKNKHEMPRLQHELYQYLLDSKTIKYMVTMWYHTCKIFIPWRRNLNIILKPEMVHSYKRLVNLRLFGEILSKCSCRHRNILVFPNVWDSGTWHERTIIVAIILVKQRATYINQNVLATQLIMKIIKPPDTKIIPLWNKDKHLYP